jgi:predicted  nucleic acid-binding Zn-ribbon protein
MRSYFWHQCIACEHQFAPDRFFYTCPDCGGLLLVVRDDDYVRSKIGSGKAARQYFDHLRYGSDRKTTPTIQAFGYGEKCYCQASLSPRSCRSKKAKPIFLKFLTG